MHIAIIGNGVSGVTAAIRIRRHHPDWKISLISGESKYHYSRPALMYIFMGHMRFQETKPFEDSYWEENRINLVRAWVTRVDVEGKQLELHGQGAIPYDRLLIATGSKPNKFGWPGQDLQGVQGLWGLYDLKQLYETAKRTRHAVIVGGGLIGIELAEMLHSRGIGVTFLVREESYWNNILPAEESAMINDLIREAKIDLLLGTELDQIVDDGQGRCCAVKTKDGRRIECELVGLTAGVTPNVDLLKGSGLELGRGVLVDRSLRTSVPDVFAAGDCAEIRTPEGERNQIQQVWYTGKMQGEVVGDVMSGQERTHDSGIWFNSAKFLDLEYQTYGKVNLRVPDEENLFWQHPEEKVAIRVVHLGGKVIGFNVMGTRWRHEVCERWLAEARPVNEVLDRLEEAHFDPEFYRTHLTQAVPALKAQLS